MQKLMARPVVRDFLRFAAVGAVATAVHYAVLIALKELAGFDPVTATVCGFAVGVVVSYFLNSRFTFNVPHSGAGFTKFALVVAVGGVINAGIVALLMHHMHYLIAQAIATGLVLIWNFAGSRLFAFRT